MGKKKRAPTVQEVRSLREQAEGHVFEVILQFEEITGLRVTEIRVERHRPAGFGATETMTVNIITKL